MPINRTLLRALAATMLGAALTVGPAVASTAATSPSPESRSTSTTATSFAVTSEKVYRAGQALTIAGTAPAGHNIWATDASGTLVAFQSTTNRDLHDDGTGFTLTVPAAHTAGESLTLGIHFGSPTTTITEIFSAGAPTGPSDPSDPSAFRVTSEKVYRAGQALTIAGTAPAGHNVWATDASGTLVAFQSNTNRDLHDDGTGFTLTVPAAHTAGESLTLGIHFGSPTTTITETFTGR